MLKKILAAIAALIVLFALLVYFKVIWILVPYYHIQQSVALEIPVMDMASYKEIWNTHRRPYIFSVSSSSGGQVHIMGIDHTKKVDDPQLDSIRYHWKKHHPDIVLVEGRGGNMISWFQDPVEEMGEGGLAIHMGNKAGIDVYSWEPPREAEIEILLKKFPVEQIAMFYTFRPYFSNMRYGKPKDPEAALQDYLESRTDYKHLKGVFTSWKELDAIWQRDFPHIEWRDYSDGIGWPKGYLHDLWNQSNLARDEYMIQIIVELVGQGRNVFVTMGSSHAPRIEKTLRQALSAL